MSANQAEGNFTPRDRSPAGEGDRAQSLLKRAQTALDSLYAEIRARHEAARKTAPRRRRFFALTRRIVALNVIALIFFVAGVMYIDANRVGLIEERTLSLTVQGRMMADALAQYATSGPEATSLDLDLASLAIGRLAGPSAARVRLYDKDGGSLLDTRYLLARNQVITERLPPPGGALEVWRVIERIYDFLVTWVPPKDYPPYTEVLGGNGFMYEEVAAASQGRVESAERVTLDGQLILSVAVPVQRLQLVLGEVLLTTETGDIDEVVRAERMALFQLTLVALIVMIVSSIILARTIARPIRALAEAAARVRRMTGGAPEIPDFSQRGDEIGELSGSLREMTLALYRRLAAIEQFAADVAHEIKNPLTSLKSAVETLDRARDDDARGRLMAVIAQDVDRINRLVTDISDASRLDAELAREKAKPVDLGRLLKAVAQIYADEARGVHVEVEAAMGALEHGGLIVDGLEGPLAQVFRNLIDNAISFSPKGGRVRVSAAPEGSEVVITVDDEGPGIADDQLNKIFGRFYTLRPEAHGFGRNSGLGLSISQQIVEMHGGAIEVSNRLRTDGTKAGARFTVRLPLAST